MENFQEVFESRKSEVWLYFRFSKATETAQCMLCFGRLSAKGSSTKGLITHLRCRHKVLLKTSAGNVDSGSSKISKLSDYNDGAERASLKQVISEQVAVYGLSFNQIAQNKPLLRAFAADGYEIPSSGNQVKNIVIKHHEELVEKMKQKFISLKQSNKRFSITFDETTTCNNKRYMNINVHSTEGVDCLGVIRIKGSMNADQAVSLVKERLQMFGLNLDSDIVATVTDAASIMLKLGKITSPIHVQCLSHGIHLAVCDVLYRTESSTDDESDSEDDCHPSLQLSLKDVVDKVRKAVKMFRKSPVKNDDALQPYVVESAGKEYRLLLDCRTRWNSLLLMLQRFYQFRKEIKLAMLQIDKKFNFSDGDLSLIKQLIEALEPFKASVNAVGSTSTDLLVAEKIVQFVINKLHHLDSNISRKLKESFVSRVKQRRNVSLIHLLEYLKRPSFIKESKDHLGAKIRRKPILDLATDLLQRLYPRADTRTISENSESCPSTSAYISIEDELHAFISKDTNENDSDDESPNVTSTDSKIVAQAMKLYEVSGKRPPCLDDLFDAVSTIIPTSVEAERAFSALGNFVTKSRNRLNDATVDALMFLRSYYKK